MKVFCYIPDVCLAEGETSSQVRRLLKEAMDAKIKPLGVPRGTRGQVVDLDETALAYVNPLGKQLNLAPGRVIGGLLYAKYLASTTSGKSGVPEPQLKGLRPGQVRTLQEAAPLFRAGKVVLAECGTGSGKGRLIAHSAAYLLSLRDAKYLPTLQPVDAVRELVGDLPLFIREHAARAQEVLERRRTNQGSESPQAVLISAPSIENVSHLIREWMAVRRLLDPECRYVSSFVLGRAQYVSASEMELILSESEQSFPAIESWLAKGMPAGLTPATAHLKSICPQIHGLMADLEYLAQDCDFPHQDAALEPDSAPEEQTMYREMRELALRADLVFTTHAMLCLDNMQLTTDSPGLLPCPLAVLVDEAHALESVQASIAAKSLSFIRLLHELRGDWWASMRKEASAKTALASAKRTIERLNDIPNDTLLPILLNSDAKLSNAWDAAQPDIKQLAADLQALLKGTASTKKAAPRTVQLRSMRYVQQAINVLSSLGSGFKGLIGHSPVQGRVSFTSGPSSVEKYISARWATTPTVMLLSGTLMHIGSNGATPTAIMKELAIPPERGAPTTPVHPSWIVETPKLMMPAPDHFHRLIPPSGGSIDPLAMSFWLHECAAVVNLAANEAKGGTLVLMTSYDRLDGLKLAISEAFPTLADRLVVQSRVNRVGACATLFKQMARAGRRPIWIGTGAAWTGLDLADDLVPDDNAAEDLLLTDLVIPNVPFGLDNTTTHVTRVNRIGFGMESMATQRRLRQGLGRLVRREGLKHRRIWLLDGRLQHPAAMSYTADLRRVLIAYIHREPFFL